MKPKLILCLALVLSGGLVGCSSVGKTSGQKMECENRPEQSQPHLYLNFFTSTFYSTTNQSSPPRLILSTRIHLFKDFDITVNDNESLKGHVESSRRKFVAHIEGHIGSDTGVFNGEVVLEKPIGPQSVAFSGYIVQMFFVLSTNHNCEPFLKQQAAKP